MEVAEIGDDFGVVYSHKITIPPSPPHEGTALQPQNVTLAAAATAMDT